MRAVHVLGGGKVEIDEFPMPEPNEQQVLIKVTASGICGSEMGSVKADKAMPMNGGHEVAGVVADPNGHPQWEEGDRVGIFTLQGCGKCRWCRAGQDTFCPEVGVCTPTHAEYCVARANALVKLDGDVSNPVAVLLCADGLGVPYGASLRAGVECGQITCVLGCGPVGLGMCLVQAYLGAHVIAVEPSAARRDLALKMGAWQVVDPVAETDMVGLLKDMTDGIGPDGCFECAGRQDTLDWALDATRPEGIIVLVGHGKQTMDPQRLIMKRNMTLMGNWIAHPGSYPEMLQMYREGLDADRLITAVFEPEDVQEAYDGMLEGTSGKVVLDWEWRADCP